MHHKAALIMVTSLTIALVAACDDNMITESVLPSEALSPEAPAALVAGTNCTTLESQSWWSTTTSIPLSGKSEHVHTQVCFPYQQVIDGTYTFTVVTKMHHTNGWYLRNVRLQAATKEGGNKMLANISRTDVRCLAEDCTFTTPVTVNLSALPAGEYEFRFHSEIRPTPSSSTKNLATTGWLACVRSCTGYRPQAVPSGQTEARGWYLDNGVTRGYINARFVDRLPSKPVSGTWCPHLRTQRGSGDEPVTHTFISVDPNFHASPENRGKVLRNAAGTFDGRLCINTTTLTNGPHKLFIRADWAPGPLAGALVVPFEVRN